MSFWNICHGLPWPPPLSVSCKSEHLVQVIWRRPILLKLALGAAFTTFGGVGSTIREPWLPNRYRRWCNKCSGTKSVFSQRPFGILPKSQPQPISGFPALQSITFLCRSTHDIMPPYKTRSTSELLALNIQLLGWSGRKSCTQQFAGKGGLSKGPQPLYLIKAAF